MIKCAFKVYISGSCAMECTIKRLPLQPLLSSTLLIKLNGLWVPFHSQLRQLQMCLRIVFKECILTFRILLSIWPAWPRQVCQTQQCTWNRMWAKLTDMDLQHMSGLTLCKTSGLVKTQCHACVQHEAIVHWKEKKRKEKFTLFSDRNKSLLRRQPRATFHWLLWCETIAVRLSWCVDSSRCMRSPNAHKISRRIWCIYGADWQALTPWSDWFFHMLLVMG